MCPTQKKKGGRAYGRKRTCSAANTQSSLTLGSKRVTLYVVRKPTCFQKASRLPVSSQWPPPLPSVSDVEENCKLTKSGSGQGLAGGEGLASPGAGRQLLCTGPGPQPSTRGHTGTWGLSTHPHLAGRLERLGCWGKEMKYYVCVSAFPGHNW